MKKAQLPKSGAPCKSFPYKVLKGESEVVHVGLRNFAMRLRVPARRRGGGRRGVDRDHTFHGPSRCPEGSIGVNAAISRPSTWGRTQPAMGTQREHGEALSGIER